jgi:holliday junction DNA helicase RuvA
MYEYFRGRLVEKNPAHVVIDCNGVGYLLHISLNTYSALGNDENQLLYAHEVIREDAHLIFGFKSQEERTIFKNLLSVTGVGASTARMVLSSMTPSEVQSAIATGNVSAFQRIKGIGAKTAQRIIIDLSGKVEKLELTLPGTTGKLRSEALSALVTLGFDRLNAEKSIDKILAADNNLSVEQLIKSALKNM